MNSTDKPIASPTVDLREEFDGWAVLFQRETAASVGINPVGAAVWKRLDGRRSAAEIAAEIRDHFSGVPGTAPEEIGSFVDELMELGFADAGGIGEDQGAAGHAEEPGVMAAPRTANVLITARCNLSCRYCCFFNDPSVDYRDLPTGEWLQFFEELGRCGVERVALSGGEPFIREDLPELLDGIVRCGMRFSLQSNGGLIDDTSAAHLAATGECAYVQVSVDGSHAETHDSFRGQGSFEGAIRGIRTLQRHGVHVIARMAIHRRNVHDIPATARFLLEELRLPSIIMAAAQAYGTGRFHAEELLLTVAEREAAMATLLNLRESCDGRIDAQGGPLFEGRMWRRMEDARQQHLPAFPEGGRLTACHCVNDELTVLPDGTMVPCFMLAHLPLGRINRDALMDTWRQSPVLDGLRKRRSIPLTDFAFCAGCGYVPYCTGNCPAPVYGRPGQADHPSPGGCLRQYLAEGGRVP